MTGWPRRWPHNLGYCQRGSTLRFSGRAMDMRNVLVYQVPLFFTPHPLAPSPVTPSCLSGFPVSRPLPFPGTLVPNFEYRSTNRKVILEPLAFPVLKPLLLPLSVLRDRASVVA